jgi:gliding motility-associated-like protein
MQRVRLTVDNGGCVGPEAFLDVNVRLSPRLTIDMRTDACQDEIVNIAVSYSTGGIDHHEWDFGPGSSMAYGSLTGGPYGIQWNSPGDKEVVVIATDNDCNSLPVRDTIHIHDLPDATITLDQTTGICAGDTLDLSAVADPRNSYQWLPQQYFIPGAGGPRQQAIVDNKAYIVLHVTNDFNCRSTDSLFIDAQPCCDIFMPNAFTPNNDGLNDKYRIVGRGKHKISVFRIQNRWGQTVFETADDTRGWDGVYNGRQQDMGTYFYYIKYQCADGNYYEDKGELILVR